MGADYFRGLHAGRREKKERIRQELLLIIDDPIALIDYIKHME